jgi:hypothetical protein
VPDDFHHHLPAPFVLEFFIHFYVVRGGADEKLTKASTCTDFTGTSLSASAMVAVAGIFSMIWDR